MKRIIPLAALCLLAFLLCSALRPDQQKESPVSPDKLEILPARPVRRSFHLIDKKGSIFKKPDQLFSTGDTGPDPAAVLPEKGESIGDPAPPAEKKNQNEAARPPRNKGNILPAPQPRMENNCIHFLLVGRFWEEPAAKVLMMVTLVPGQCARITALDPAAKVEMDNINCSVGELPEQHGDRDRLYRAVTSLTGLTPQFYIDLNLKGLAEMIDLLQKREEKGGAASSPEWLYDGEEMLQLLINAGSPAEAREKALVQLLLAACEIQFTPLGLKLLWMGYHNLKTDLSLEDLLKIRKITQGIAPTDVSLIEAVP